MWFLWYLETYTNVYKVILTLFKPPSNDNPSLRTVEIFDDLGSSVKVGTADFQDRLVWGAKPAGFRINQSIWLWAGQLGRRSFSRTHSHTHSRTHSGTLTHSHTHTHRPTQTSSDFMQQFFLLKEKFSGKLETFSLIYFPSGPRRCQRETQVQKKLKNCETLLTDPRWKSTPCCWPSRSPSSRWRTTRPRPGTEARGRSGRTTPTASSKPSFRASGLMLVSIISQPILPLVAYITMLLPGNTDLLWLVFPAITMT